MVNELAQRITNELWSQFVIYTYAFSCEVDKMYTGGNSHSTAATELYNDTETWRISLD